MFFCRNNCQNPCGDRQIQYVGIPGPQGVPGPAGPQGPQGPTGATGPAGMLPNENATVYNASTQTITTGTALTLPTVLTNNSLTSTGSGLTVTNGGTYLVSFTTGTATDATGTDNVGIALNGTILTATQRLLTTAMGTSGTFVLNLTAGDTLTLIPTVTGATAINDTGESSATLTVVRIS